VDGSGVLQFTGAESGSMSKPTTQMVFACAGFPGYVGAALSAAFNRGVARDGADFYVPSTYYKRSLYKNEFAQVLHEISIHNLAYGFGYDDNNNQSSVLIVGSSQPLDSLVLTIEPFVSNVGAVVPNHAAANVRPAIRYANDRITVAGAAQIDRIKLISPDGRCVREARGNVMSTVGLAAGSYNVKIMDNQGHVSLAKVVTK